MLARIAYFPPSLCRDSYFCFTRKGGYSGVATYVKTAASTVRAAEEGLLRVLPPQNPVSAAAQHVAAAPGCPPAAQTADAGTQAAAASATTAWPREIVFPAKQLRAMFTPEEALAVDKDGRCIITGVCACVCLWAPTSMIADGWLGHITQSCAANGTRHLWHWYTV